MSFYSSKLVCRYSFKHTHDICWKQCSSNYKSPKLTWKDLRLQFSWVVHHNRCFQISCGLSRLKEGVCILLTESLEIIKEKLLSFEKIHFKTITYPNSAFQYMFLSNIDPYIYIHLLLLKGFWTSSVVANQ